jgi:acyl-CoA synthetase (AMP-forming)/AMP-acid ligase II
MTPNEAKKPQRHSRFESTRFSSIVELTRHRAGAQPLDKAYVFLKDGELEAGTLTYRALDQRARAIAVQLREHVKPGDRVMLVYPPGLDFVSAFFGCLYGGVVAVPVYPPSGPNDWPRFEKIALDARPTVVCTNRSRIGSIQSASSAAGPGVRESLQYLVTDDADDARASQWEDPRLDRESLAFLQYTSGSTGVPKGVMVSNGNLLHNQWMVQKGFEHSKRTLFVGWLPLYHDMGLIGNVLQPLYLGIPSILMSPAAFVVKPVRWLQAISRYRATTSGGPNFAYELCVHRITEEQKAGLDLDSWDIAFNGSEMVRRDTLERFAEKFAPSRFRKSAFLCCYGLAESTLFVSGSAKSANPTVKSIDADSLQQHRVIAAGESTKKKLEVVGCGRAFELEVAIVNPETRLRCTPESIGEIWVKGKSVAQGYWNNPESTKATFRASLANTGEGPYMRTGDLGFIQDGHLFVTGRLKDLIIIRGRNYYPNDIEAAVQASHPCLKVDCGAAFSVDVEGAESLIVVQEIDRTRGRELDPAHVAGTVRLALMSQLGLPLRELVLIKQGKLPKTSSGKIRRGACREAYLRRELELFSQATGRIPEKKTSPIAHQPGASS